MLAWFHVVWVRFVKGIEKAVSQVLAQAAFNKGMFQNGHRSDIPEIIGAHLASGHQLQLSFPHEPLSLSTRRPAGRSKRSV